MLIYYKKYNVKGKYIMNKKLISIVIAGIIAVTSLPVVSASATEVNTFNTQSSTWRPRTLVGTKFVRLNADAYSSLSSHTYAGKVSSTVKCAIYTNTATDNNPDWYYVRCKINGNSSYDFYYVKKENVIW
jgi:hypothetical protein